MTFSETDYAKAYKELYILLHYVPENYLEKLPAELVHHIEQNMDQDYDYDVNPDLSYRDNEKSYMTSLVLGNLFRDYWANPAQKEFLINKELKDKEDYEILVRELFDPNQVFVNHEEVKAESLDVEEEKNIEEAIQEDKQVPDVIRKNQIIEKIKQTDQS